MSSAVARRSGSWALGLAAAAALLAPGWKLARRLAQWILSLRRVQLLPLQDASCARR